MDDIITEQPQLEAEVIEYILFNSIAKISFSDLLYKIQKNLPISSFILKKYLNKKKSELINQKQIPAIKKIIQILTTA